MRTDNLYIVRVKLGIGFDICGFRFFTIGMAIVYKTRFGNFRDLITGEKYRVVTDNKIIGAKYVDFSEGFCRFELGDFGKLHMSRKEVLKIALEVMEKEGFGPEIGDLSEKQMVELIKKKRLEKNK